MNNVVTEDKDEKLDEEKFSALSRCGYSKWAFTLVKDKMANKQVKRKNNEKDTTKQWPTLNNNPIVYLYPTKFLIHLCLLQDAQFFTWTIAGQAGRPLRQI